MQTLLLIHGPNLNKLGERDPSHYGDLTLDALEQKVKRQATELGFSIHAFQSNHEGALIDFIQNKASSAQGIIINPGGYSHTSVALLDALLDVKLPIIEVHLSNIQEREDFRHNSITGNAAIKVVSGKGVEGYMDALEQLSQHLPAPCQNSVIGSPLSHSLSPLFHQALYDALDLSATLNADERPLAESLHDFRAQKAGLLAVTMPYKRDVLAYCDEVSKEVKDIGVANTLINRNGKILAYNTDLSGFAYAFRNTKLEGKKALIIGAGDTATTAAYFLTDKGARLNITNRTFEKAQALATQFGATAIPKDTIETHAFDIILNTTSLGMNSYSEQPLDNLVFAPHQAVFDVVYSPRETALLKAASECGASTISGIDLFLGQAVAQVALWTDQALDAEAYQGLLETCMRQKSEIAPGIAVSDFPSIQAYTPDNCSRIAIITDSTVEALYATPLKAHLLRCGKPVDILAFPAGEANKNADNKAQLEAHLFQRHFDRKSLIIALGGGVTGDLAGFIAATYMRGIPFIQVPTSTMAMIDSSVGGKTAINTPYGKNTLGAFWKPKAVIMPMHTLLTLPMKERINGLIEALKIFLLFDSTALEEAVAAIPRIQSGDITPFEPIIRKAVALKLKLVNADFRDNNARMVLNFGHTLGHALEHLSDYTLPHGYAVAYGMLLEAEISHQLGHADTNTVDYIRNIIIECKLSLDSLASFSIEHVLELLHQDKKTTSGDIHMSLITGLGSFLQNDNTVVFPVSRSLIKSALTPYLQKETCHAR